MGWAVRVHAALPIGREGVRPARRSRRGLRDVGGRAPPGCGRNQEDGGRGDDPEVVDETEFGHVSRVVAVVDGKDHLAIVGLGSGAAARSVPRRGTDRGVVGQAWPHTGDDRDALGTVLSHQLRHLRARPDERHVADDDVQELRQLVELVTAQHAADPGDAWIATDRERPPIEGAPTTMVRNLWIAKGAPCHPTRTCRNITGPPSSRRIATAMTARTGDRTIRAEIAATRSNARLRTRLARVELRPGPGETRSRQVASTRPSPPSERGQQQYDGRDAQTDGAQAAPSPARSLRRRLTTARNVAPSREGRVARASRRDERREVRKGEKHRVTRGLRGERRTRYRPRRRPYPDKGGATVRPRSTGRHSGTCDRRPAPHLRQWLIW